MRAGEPAAKKTLEVEGRIVRKGAQAPLGIGRVAEQFASQKHGAEVATNQQENAVAISSARQASEEATRQAAEKNHEITTKNIQDISRARQTSEEAVRKIEEANAQTATDYEKQKLLMEAQYKRDMQKFERARSAQALTSQEKGSRPSATSEAAGANGMTPSGERLEQIRRSIGLRYSKPSKTPRTISCKALRIASRCSATL
jgi:hypothetical protein